MHLGVHRIPIEYVDGLSDDPHIGRMFDAWLVVQKVGAGGVGEIYLAEQQPVGLRAALKQLSHGGGPLASPERFLREAAALARLSHPNIVRLLAYGMREATPYLVMEYVDGGRTLAASLATLEPDDRLRVLLQVTHALEAAHARGVVHRDLKPANIMLQAVAGEPHFVRLVDFGLAKFMDGHDKTTVMAGSPHYMAPEQMSRAPIGPRTDLYALGVIACELYTGQRPFGGPTVNSILLQKSDPNFDPVAALSAPLDPPTAEFLRRAMALDPEARFPDAPALRAALVALGPPTHPGLAATAAIAPPEPAGPRPSPRAGRPLGDERSPQLGRRAALATGIAALGAAGWWWFSDRGASSDGVTDGAPTTGQGDALDGAVVDATPSARRHRFDQGLSDARPSDARPMNARPMNARPMNARPMNARPSNARPADARSTDAGPIDAQLVDARPGRRPPPPQGRGRGRPDPDDRPSAPGRDGPAAAPTEPTNTGLDGLKMDPAWTKENSP